MTERYNSQWVRQHFDGYGEKEWDRMVKDPVARVSLHVHTHYLREYIKTGFTVLEAGAGAGRFTQALVGMGALVEVGDISEVQLALNEKYAAELRFEHGVVKRARLDICDLGAYGAESFDAVVCYGGPLSYVFERREQAVREMMRVLKPGGVMLVSVMALWGTIHRHLDGVCAISREENGEITRSGDLCVETYKASKHHCHMFRAVELRALLEGFGVVECMSACACLCVGWEEKLGALLDKPEVWEELLRMEVEACREPGALDMGTHLIAVARKRGG
jgi:SAM-dependent methyltransferase